MPNLQAQPPASCFAFPKAWVNISQESKDSMQSSGVMPIIPCWGPYEIRDLCQEGLGRAEGTPRYGAASLQSAAPAPQAASGQVPPLHRKGTPEHSVCVCVAKKGRAKTESSRGSPASPEGNPPSPWPEAKAQLAETDPTGQAGSGEP